MVAPTSHVPTPKWTIEDIPCPRTARPKVYDHAPMINGYIYIMLDNTPTDNFPTSIWSRRKKCTVEGARLFIKWQNYLLDLYI